MKYDGEGRLLIGLCSFSFGAVPIRTLYTGHAELERGTRRPPTAGRGPVLTGRRDTRDLKSAPVRSKIFSPPGLSEFRFPEPGAERYFRVSLSRSDGLQRPKVPLPQCLSSCDFYLLPTQVATHPTSNIQRTELGRPNVPQRLPSASRNTNIGYGFRRF